MSDRTSHLLLLALVAAFAVLAHHSLEQKSVTIDEYGYLPAAYNLVSTDDLRFSEWHTPLVNGLLGLPLVGADVIAVDPPTGTPAEGRYWFWNNGRWFEEANGERYHALLVRARLVSVADVFDALTSARVYKDAMDPQTARRIIEDEADEQFDPTMVDAFRATYDDFLIVLCASGHGHEPEPVELVTADAR